ncbi:VCBS repeat-containing protein [Azospira inquinata]|uniref:VCBS repeat-containing protein n=1 Tax=Azospira inquinata TaxID=2785627 RepID=A0A975XUB0_9RHOO|nr:VCBS repeat-containing protein [Azospira inquinata]QWT46101.1 VCBS repeat-containing protein [Azospira inquinata]QWT48570.1 VCBS repeat-containing protein [Azospira inquinata]
MKIADANLNFSASHRYSQQWQVEERLRYQIGTPSTATGAGGANPARGAAVLPTDSVSLSSAGLAAQTGDMPLTDRNQLQLTLIQMMLEMLTGHKAKLFSLADLTAPSQDASLPAPGETSSSTTTAPASAGYGLDYQYLESYTEREQTDWAASGVVHTADGQEIHFDLSLQMQYSYQETSQVHIQAGDRLATQDPLVLNFGGSAAELTNQKFQFDLNNDGQQENMAFATGGSGFLVLDKNGNGKIDNGSELFGPSSGNGYGELAAYDEDHNGWIDAGDRVFSQLQVLSKNAQGQDQLRSLHDLGIGALSLAASPTPFAIKDEQNQLLAQVRNTGLFLQEDGKAGTMQQLDLAA